MVRCMVNPVPLPVSKAAAALFLGDHVMTSDYSMALRRRMAVDRQEFSKET